MYLYEKTLKNYSIQEYFKIHSDASNSIMIIPDWYSGTKLSENSIIGRFKQTNHSFDKKL